MPWPSNEPSLFTDCSRKACRFLVLAILTLPLLACSVVGDMLDVEVVKPWQRGTLARDDMQLITDALEQSVDDHIYFSREAATGGVSIQGGGCGCN